MTAISVKREGKSVIIIEPSKWVGGILGAGLKPIQDMPKYEAVGGSTRDLLKKLGTGPLEEREIKELAHDPHGPFRVVMKKQSPRDIRADFRELLAKDGIEVIFSHRINFIHKEGTRLVQAVFDLASYDEYGVPPAK